MEQMSARWPFFATTNPASLKGFTLIEILVTLFIVAIGLLGLAALVLEGMRNNQGAYLRTQATVLAYDMADRMRANKSNVTDYAGFSTDGASTKLPDCVTSDAGCPPTAQVTRDLVEWTREIQGVGSDMALLPGGEGEIERDAGTSVYTITITWEEVSRDGSEIDSDNSYSVQLAL
ncbi:type IV pilus assembly protein PilV [Marinobacter persicus]|uniref:Type IV pilus assembly protein PilV n=1 Tax=Marinobacter persicus TaxID=930118 RepID=A0A1I3X2S5_9GAMM|nr:type IV pilus modification protein PilV [Marinobacter persicus]GHD48540.1 type IV pilus modification protein PilV [Marinobacter persicus]SFK14092.1 type IV pilus assembly protein PilV [Marinobacter persicus]